MDGKVILQHSCSCESCLAAYVLKHKHTTAVLLLLLHAGNEGYGVRPLVKRLCTQLVQIEMTQDDRHRMQLVDSLNVSVATGILLHHMLASTKPA